MIRLTLGCRLHVKQFRIGLENTWKIHKLELQHVALERSMSSKNSENSENIDLLTYFCPESDQAIQIWATFVRTSTLGIFKNFPKICPDSPEAYPYFRQIFVRKRTRGLTGLSWVLT